MKKKYPLSYRTIQKIKAEEFERFFSQVPDYYLYMNHLGEVQWMTEEQALNQHEFFLYSESALKSWQRRFRLKRKIDLSRLPEAEKELRLCMRQYLGKTYLGKITEETKQHLPEHWTYELSNEELENIPLTIDIGSENIWLKLIVAITVLAALAIVSFFWIGQGNQAPAGRLMVKTDVVGARIYLDSEDLLGYSNKVIQNVPVGMHRISAYKDGYIAIPEYHEVEITPDSLTTLEFKFNRRQSEGQGYLHVFAANKDSKIFIDNKYYGKLSEKSVLVLEEGQHRISLQKKGFVTTPSERIVRISSGDTATVSFSQDPLPRSRPGSRAGSRTGMGSLEVSSNVNNARIFLNGKDSGFETDYVFTELPLGTYSVSVRKEGYTVEPEQLTVSLSRQEPLANARFQLVKEFEKVTITTTPANGAIYIDGEFKGEGKFEGVLKTGEYTISFGDISGYNTPKEHKVDLKPDSPLILHVNYFAEMKIVAGIDSRGHILSENCDVYTGYTMNNQAFTTSEEGGPSVEYSDKLGDYVWKLGFAFPYRNPKGNDAIRVVFKLPDNLDYNQNFTLRLLAASSKEKYPLSLSEKTDIKIKINNTILSHYYEPKFLEELGGLEVVEWNITANIEPGRNEFEISTTRNNNTFFYIKRIEIFN